MPPRRNAARSGSSRVQEEEEVNGGGQPQEQQPQEQNLPPPPPFHTGQPVQVDGAQLVQTVNTLLNVLMQQQQQMRQDVQAIQANAEAWREETHRLNNNGGNGGNGARRTDALSLNKFVDLVPKFEPKLGKPLEPQLWMEEVEKTFSALDIPEEKKVEYATFLLTGTANNWWLSTKRNLGGAVTWERFQQAFYAEYFPESVRNQMLQEYYTLQQGRRTVEEYEAELNRLMRFLPEPLRASEEAKKSRFITGLEPHIQYQVNLMEVATYSAAVNKAKMVEQGLNRVKEHEAPRGQVVLGKRPATNILVQDKGKKPITPLFRPVGQGTEKRCFRCQGPHELKDCKWPENACFSCGKTGHNHRYCTEKTIP